MIRTLPNGDVEEYTDFHYSYNCLVCGDEVSTDIIVYNNIFEHDNKCVFCCSDTEWVKKEMFSAGESEEDFNAYVSKRKHNEELLNNLKK